MQKEHDKQDYTNVLENTNNINSITVKDLLEPISLEKPCGEFLRYSNTYDLIKQARLEDENLPQGVWERELKKADWKEVKNLCLKALKDKTKDLQIIVWLIESFVHLKNFEGLKEGFEILNKTCVNFWENLFPEILNGDVEERVSPMIWLNEKLPLKLKLLSLTIPQANTDSRAYNFADWENANLLEKLSQKDKASLKKDQQDQEEQITRAKFLGSVLFTPRNFYEKLLADLNLTIFFIKKLDEFLDVKCQKDAPSFNKLKNILQEIQFLVSSFLSEKQESQEKNEMNNSDSLQSQSNQLDQFGEKEHNAERLDNSGFNHSALSIKSRSDAYRMLSVAADYLLMHEPHSPTPYLVKRAVGWGNMTLTELLEELINDEHDLRQIFKLLGLQDMPRSK